MSPGPSDANDEREPTQAQASLPRAQPAAEDSAHSVNRSSASPRQAARKGAPSKLDDGLLVELIALGNTSEQAAAKLGVCARTVSRHRADSSLRVAIAARRAELVNDVGARLASHGFQAVDVLVEGMNGEDPRLRHQSAKALLDRIVPFRRAGELEDRIVQLERATSTDETPPSGWPGEPS